MKIGLVIHSGRPESVEAAVAAARRLTTLGADVVAVQQDDEPVDEVPAVTPDAFAHGLDLAISFGGDGTLLRAAHLIRDAGVPVLGLNLGRLGFLAEIERDDMDATLDAVVAGRYEVEERPTLQVRVVSDDRVDRPAGPDGEAVLLEDWALNEVSIEKTARQRVLLMDVHVGGSLYAKTPADALVVATATGSTAYAFSAGGPILSPKVRAMLVTPVAPHSVFGRTLVAAEDEEVRVEILPDQAPAVVSCDGRSPVTVRPGGAVHAVGGGRPVRLARVAPHDFYGVVRAKFGLR